MSTPSKSIFVIIPVKEQRLELGSKSLSGISLKVLTGQMRWIKGTLRSLGWDMISTLDYVPGDERLTWNQKAMIAESAKWEKSTLEGAKRDIADSDAVGWMPSLKGYGSPFAKELMDYSEALFKEIYRISEITGDSESRLMRLMRAIEKAVTMPKWKNTTIMKGGKSL